MTERTYTPDMREISGFGGGYEDTCRKMVLAGLDWLEAHPDANPMFHGYKHIYGVITEDNDDAKALTEAVIAASGGDCTGAMHQACIGHILAARRLGWDAYCEEMRKPHD